MNDEMQKDLVSIMKTPGFEVTVILCAFLLLSLSVGYFSLKDKELEVQKKQIELEHRKLNEK